MLIRAILAALLAVVLGVSPGRTTTLLPPGEQCFQATAGLTGMVGLLGAITGGSSYTNGSYGGVALTGGVGINATANITVSGGVVTAVTILNPGVQYVVGDVLSADAASIGGSGSGFSVPVASISINSSLAGGSVGYFIPNTQTTKQTWQDSGQVTLNTNPVNLDANGCATVYGSGIYRQIVKDSLGNTVWDKLTAATDANNPFYAGVAGGTGNAITITDTSFALQDGSLIQFLANATNTAAVTVSVSGGTPIAIVQDTSTGPASLTAGQIAQGNLPLIAYDAANALFHLVNPSTTAASTSSASLVTPQGYLNLVGQASGDIIQTGDVIGTTTIFYSPYVGNIIPVWNGSSYRLATFSELTATLTAAGSPSNTIQDVCVFSNNGVPTLVVGPSWTTVAAGSGSRGTGAGTAQIVRVQGLWVNANTITGYNGLTSYSVASNQCTYVGSLSIDATAGQVSAYRTYGQSRKFGIWNTYNRATIYLMAGDPTASWTYNAATIRPSNNNANNKLTVFSGLIEEPVSVSFVQSVTTVAAGSASANIGIGFNSTTAITGTHTPVSGVSSSGIMAAANGIYQAAPFLGINTIQALEFSSTTDAQTFFGTSSSMLLAAQWRG